MLSRVNCRKWITREVDNLKGINNKKNIAWTTNSTWIARNDGSRLFGSCGRFFSNLLSLPIQTNLNTEIKKGSPHFEKLGKHILRIHMQVSIPQCCPSYHNIEYFLKVLCLKISTISITNNHFSQRFEPRLLCLFTRITGLTCLFVTNALFQWAIPFKPERSASSRSN